MNAQTHTPNWQPIETAPRNTEVELSFDGRSYFRGKHQQTFYYPLEILFYSTGSRRFRYLRPKLWRECATGVTQP